MIGSRDCAGLGLSKHREKKAISLKQIAQSTKIAIRSLQAIEAGEFKKLPGGIYNTSYIRQYARAIDFDESELLAYYRSRTDVQPAIPIAQEKRQNLRDFRFLMQH